MGTVLLKKESDINEYLFNRRVIDPDTGCWRWTQAKSGNGYGFMHFNDKEYSVHRMSAHLFLGMDLNDERIVMHKCDNKSCFNPDHLEIGNQAINISDYHKKHPKQYCSNGHEMTEENSYRYYNKVFCRTCRKENGRKRYIR